MIKRCLLAFFCIAMSAALFAEGESDAWLGAFDTMEAGTRHWELGEYDEAMEKYRQAREQFAALHRKYPDWRTDLVLFRWAYCGEKLADCRRHLDEPLEALSRRALEAETLKAREKAAVLLKGLRELTEIKRAREELIQSHALLTRENERLKADRKTWEEKKAAVGRALSENRRLKAELEKLRAENAKLRKLQSKGEAKP